MRLQPLKQLLFGNLFYEAYRGSNDGILCSREVPLMSSMGIANSIKVAAAVVSTSVGSLSSPAGATSRDDHLRNSAASSVVSNIGEAGGSPDGATLEKVIAGVRVGFGATAQAGDLVSASRLKIESSPIMRQHFENGRLGASMIEGDRVKSIGALTLRDAATAEMVTKLKSQGFTHAAIVISSSSSGGQLQLQRADKSTLSLPFEIKSDSIDLPGLKSLLPQICRELLTKTTGENTHAWCRQSACCGK